MKITFVCGSFEPGRDGVGDYVRRLAIELIRQGNSVGVVALNDYDIVEPILQNQYSDNIILPSLRLPSCLNISKRNRFAKEWIERFNPDILSLQFVVFSFHIKGLPFNLSDHLLFIAGGRCWHIMFHELWVGMPLKVSTSQILWGRLQRVIIKRLIKKLNPKIIHTQTQFYQQQLFKIGFKSNYLPLFGNIPIAESSKEELENRPYIGISKRSFIITLFGTIHPDVHLNSFTEDVANYTKRFKVDVQLKIIGRSGSGLSDWVSVWRSAGLTVDILGEQPPEIVSQVFHSASLGISTTPLVLLEKSGAVAAMREHGLPILCVRQPCSTNDEHDFTLPAGIMQYEVGCFEKCVRCLSKIPPKSNLKEIGLTLSKELLDAINAESDFRHKPSNEVVRCKV